MIDLMMMAHFLHTGILFCEFLLGLILWILKNLWFDVLCAICLGDRLEVCF